MLPKHTQAEATKAPQLNSSLSVSALQTVNRTSVFAHKYHRCGAKWLSLPRYHCNVDPFLSFSENTFFFPFLSVLKGKSISRYWNTFPKWPCGELEEVFCLHHDFQFIHYDSVLNYLHIIKNKHPIVWLWLFNALAQDLQFSLKNEGKTQIGKVLRFEWARPFLGKECIHGLHMHAHM